MNDLPEKGKRKRAKVKGDARGMIIISNHQAAPFPFFVVAIICSLGAATRQVG
jgi:hypothetical protein